MQDNSSADSAVQTTTTLSPDAVAHRFSFRGSAGEYFKIWIVNVLLSVLTLGIYSAWAKVRNRRYFYSNTFLDGANFDYHANPVAILIARIAVLTIFLVAQYLLSPELYGDEFGIALAIFIFIFLPWAWVRGLSFNARNSSYRNVRFRFHRAYGTPYLMYGLILVGIGVFLSPWLYRDYHRYKAEHHQLGNRRFSFNTPGIGIYILLPFVGFVAVVLLIVGVSLFVQDTSYFLATVITVPMGIFLISMAASKAFRLLWDNIRCDGGGILRCEFSTYDFAKILMVNLFASILSLGLLIPWAKVRKTKFLAENMVVYAPPELFDSIAAKRSDDESAFGEEMDTAEGFDFDVGIV